MATLYKDVEAFGRWNLETVLTSFEHDGGRRFLIAQHAYLQSDYGGYHEQTRQIAETLLRSGAADSEAIRTAVHMHEAAFGPVEDMAFLDKAWPGGSTVAWENKNPLEALRFFAGWLRAEWRAGRRLPLEALSKGTFFTLGDDEVMELQECPTNYETGWPELTAGRGPGFSLTFEVPRSVWVAPLDIAGLCADAEARAAAQGRTLLEVFADEAELHDEALETWWQAQEAHGRMFPEDGPVPGFNTEAERLAAKARLFPDSSPTAAESQLIEAAAKASERLGDDWLEEQTALAR